MDTPRNPAVLYSSPATPDGEKAKHHIRVKAYEWTNKDSTPDIPGVRINNYSFSVFVPHTDMRAVADALHDLADEYDQKEN